MDARGELARFLRAKREQTPVPPDSLFPTEGRRVAGLRREEVAELALISATYYTKLERGKVHGISAAVLDGLTSALALTPQERAYVASLIPIAGTAAGSPAHDDPMIPTERLLRALGETPAHVHNERADIIATNPAGRALYPYHFEHSEHPNTIAFLFLDPRAQQFFVNWKQWADQGVFFLRNAVAGNPRSRSLATLVGRLRERSTVFDEAWQSHLVAFQQFGTRELNHPVAGRLAIDFQGLQPIGHDRTRIVVYTAEPGSDTAESRRMPGSSFPPHAPSSRRMPGPHPAGRTAGHDPSAPHEIPACAGMTRGCGGMTRGCGGTTRACAGMTRGRRDDEGSVG